MNTRTAPHGWQSVRDEVLRRIADKVWRPGELIPNEADLAQEFGCARTTVNRALRSLSDEGLLERRRKGGTRIAQQPVGRATIKIPLIRQEIDELGCDYGYRLLGRDVARGPDGIRAQLAVPSGSPLVHVVSLHLAGDAPYALEYRWINPATVPDAVEAPFDRLSANEWLVNHLPFTRAESEFEAVAADAERARVLGCIQGEALILHRRMTWLGEAAITLVEFTFAKGHRIRSGG